MAGHLVWGEGIPGSSPGAAIRVVQIHSSRLGDSMVEGFWDYACPINISFRDHIQSLPLRMIEVYYAAGQKGIILVNPTLRSNVGDVRLFWQIQGIDMEREV